MTYLHAAERLDQTNQILLQQRVVQGGQVCMYNNILDQLCLVRIQDVLRNIYKGVAPMRTWGSFPAISSHSVDMTRARKHVSVNGEHLLVRRQHL